VLAHLNDVEKAPKLPGGSLYSKLTLLGFTLGLCWTILPSNAGSNPSARAVELRVNDVFSVWRFRPN
jgi:hypothetical protein